jgi:hypothetical protein
VEACLLIVAARTDRSPRANDRPGSTAAVRSLCRREMLRITVSGYDPLAPPRSAGPMHRARDIKISKGAKNLFEPIHDWRFRRLRKPIVA